MKKTGWLIYQKQDIKQNKAYIDWFKLEAELQNIELKLITREELTIGIKSNEKCIFLHDKPVYQLPHFAIVRTIEPILNLHLETLNIKVFNSYETSSICNHKSLTYHYINQLNVLMVDTVYTQIENFPVQSPIDFPLIIKEATGRGGQQVHLVKDEIDWKSIRSKLVNNDIVIQKANVELGKDVRVFVIGHEIISAVLRQSDTDFRSNYRLGGSVKSYELDRKEKKIVQKIIKHFNFDLVGIDFLVSKEGDLLFNEIEDVVGSRTLSATSNINLLQKYISHIKQHI